MINKHVFVLSFIHVHLVVQLLRPVQLFAAPGTAAWLSSLSFSVSQSVHKLMSIELVMPSNHLILCRPLSPCTRILIHHKLIFWKAKPFSPNLKKCWSLSCVWLFATPWTVAHQAPLSMGFLEKYWEWVAISFSRGSSLPSEPLGKP